MQTVGQRQCLLINSPATDNETFFKLLLSRQVQGRMQCKDVAVTQPLKSFACRLMMMLSLCGSGRPIASKVLRPMMIALFKVSFLKRPKSSGRCHGIPFCVGEVLPPITPFAAMAAMSEIFIPPPARQWRDVGCSR